ncbi:MAG: PAS domain S-box protein [Smithella sp.]
MKNKSLRALIIEDSEEDVLLIIRELKKGGYNPVYEWVKTASAMTKALEEKQWDIILCDYKMPNFSAPSAIAILKKASINIPIIIVSGTISEETAIECMRLGAQDYIMKSNLSRLCPAIAREIEETEVRNKSKLAQKERKRSEDIFRTIFANNSSAMAIIEQDTTISMVNSEYCKISGYTEKEVVGTSWTQYIPPKDLERLKEYNQRRLINPQDAPDKYETRFYRKNGETGTCLMSVAFIPNIKKILVSFVDITERKQAEEKLKEQDVFFKKLSSNVPGGLYQFIRRPDGTYCLPFSTEGIKDMFGCSPEDARDDFSSITKVILPEDLDAFIDSIECSAKNLTDWQCEYRVQIPGKPVKWLLGHSTPEKLADGSITWHGFNTDITILKLAEEKYRNIFENAQEGIYQSTPEGRFTLANQSMARILGYDSPEDLISGITDIAHQVYVDSEERTKFVEIIEKEGFTKNHEVQFRRKEGTIIWVSRTMQVIRDEKGQILYEGILEDITERKESIDRLRNALGGTVKAIASMVETRDPYTAGHQRRVADLAIAIATEMGLSKDRVEGLRVAAVIHDIGKISVPAEILSKPSKLTDIEFRLIKTHVQSGNDILKDIDFPWPIARMVLEHHERMNGSGYPNGLTGDKLLLESRIMAVADAVEAMASHRPYRASLGIEATLEEIDKNRGILYDIAVADACLRLFREKGYKIKD